jgi:Fe-S oxidoreductase
MSCSVVTVVRWRPAMRAIARSGDGRIAANFPLDDVRPSSVQLPALMAARCALAGVARSSGNFAAIARGPSRQFAPATAVLTPPAEICCEVDALMSQAASGRAPGHDAPMRVAVFATCLVDALFPDAGKATVEVLERLGQPIEFPLEQTCCGQMHANSGYFEPGLVRRYVDTFSDYDAVVVPSGSCAGAIRH